LHFRNLVETALSRDYESSSLPTACARFDWINQLDLIWKNVHRDVSIPLNLYELPTEIFHFGFNGALRFGLDQTLVPNDVTQGSTAA
jgi:hypothetical protein